MSTDNKMVEIKELARCGDNIRDCIWKVLKLLHSMDPKYMSAKGAYFDFNGSRVNVYKDETADQAYARWQREWDERCEAYRKSPEGIESEKRRVKAAEDNRKKFDAAYGTNPDFSNYAAVVEWIGAWEPYTTTDTFNKQKAAFILRRLTDAGYKIDAHCTPLNASDDIKKAWTEILNNDRRRFGEYLIGQAMSCLSIGMPPHQVYGHFLEKWRNIPSTKEE